MPSSLAIGDFSRATHLSVKTLRHYHQLGLLIPAEVDPDSSYRRYTTEQIPTAQVIRRFRDLDMPLEQIGAVLQAPDVARRNELIAAHLARLEQELLETQEAVGLAPRPAPGPVAGAAHGAPERAGTADRRHHRDGQPRRPGSVVPGRARRAGRHVGAQGVTTTGPPGAVVADDFFADERGESPFSSRRRADQAVGRVEPRAPRRRAGDHRPRRAHTDIDRAYGALATYVSTAPWRRRAHPRALPRGTARHRRRDRVADRDRLAHLPHRTGRLSGRRTEAIHAGRESPATQPATMSATSASLLRNE